MKQMGLKNKLSKEFKVTTDSKHNYLTVENILNRQFNPKSASKVWVSDITYIHTKEGFFCITPQLLIYMIENNWLEFKRHHEYRKYHIVCLANGNSK